MKQLAERLDDGMSHFIPQDVYLAQHSPLARVAHQGDTCRFGAEVERERSERTRGYLRVKRGNADRLD